MRLLGCVISDRNCLFLCRKPSAVSKAGFVIPGDQLRFVCAVAYFGWMLVRAGCCLSGCIAQFLSTRSLTVILTVLSVQLLVFPNLLRHNCPEHYEPHICPGLPQSLYLNLICNDTVIIRLQRFAHDQILYQRSPAKVLIYRLYHRMGILRFCPVPQQFHISFIIFFLVITRIRRIIPCYIAEFIT